MLNLASDGFVESLCIFLLKIAKEYHGKFFKNVKNIFVNIVDEIF